jgi:hypothetical protein
VSALAAVAIYAISQFTHRRPVGETAGPDLTPTPAA